MTKAAGTLLLCFAAFLLATALSIAPAAAQSGTAGQTLTPEQAADELLAADRAFAAAAAGVDMVTGLSAMFDAQVVMPLPGGQFARGREAAIAALRANPFNAASRVEWAPVRAGISADGRHGFTFGFLTTRGDDGSVRPGKYLAYWIRTPQGWRAAAYKRVPRPEGEVSTALLAPALPARLVPAAPGAVAAERHRESLRAAEQAFSDEAQRIGLGPAFQRNGSADAMNMGAGPGFTLGAEAIGGAMPPGATSPVSWHADDALVAGSGDLGVTWGVIRPNQAPAAGQPAGSSFFTVWRRAGADGRWLYIAE